MEITVKKKDFYSRLGIPESDRSDYKDLLTKTLKETRNLTRNKWFYISKEDDCFKTLNVFGCLDFHIHKATGFVRIIDNRLAVGPKALPSSVGSTINTRIYLHPLLNETVYSVYNAYFYHFFNQYLNDKDSKLDYKSRSIADKLRKSCSNMSYYQNYRKNKIVKIVAGHIWNLLNQEALEILKHTRYYSSTFEEYNYIVSNLEEAKRIYKTQPSTITLWLQSASENSSTELCNKKTIVRSFVTENCFDTSNYEKREIVSESKKYLNVANGFVKPAWKYSLKTHPYTLNMILKSANGRQKENNYILSIILGSLTKINDVPIKYSAIRGIIRKLKAYDLHTQSRLSEYKCMSYMLKAALIEASKKRAYCVLKKEEKSESKKDQIALSTNDSMRAVKERRDNRYLKNFISNEFEFVMDWIVAEYPELDNNQKRAKWSWYMDRARDYHERILTIQNEQYAKYQWSSLCNEEVKIKEAVFKPIVNGLDLRIEGKSMHHCVGSTYYMESCQRNDNQIFSVTMEGNKGESEERATLQLIKRNSDMSWSVGQFYGYCNTPVSSKLTAIAKDFVNYYNKLEKKQEKLEIVA